MKVEKIREIARSKGIANTSRMKKAVLIHAIQKAEGNPQCFSTDPHTCGQENCLWRQDCFEAVKKR